MNPVLEAKDVIVRFHPDDYRIDKKAAHILRSKP